MIKTKNKKRFPCACRRVSQPTMPEQFLDSVKGRRGIVALESLYPRCSYGRWTLIGIDPVRTWKITATYGNGFLEPIRAIRSEFVVDQSSDIPFAGGWMGYLGYEMGQCLERLPGQAVRDLDVPDAWLALYDTVVLFDHHQSEWWVAGFDSGDVWDEKRAGLDQRLDQLEFLIGSARNHEPPPSLLRTLDTDEEIGLPAGVSATSREDYHAKVRRILDHIRRGDAYQVNLTERLEAVIRGSGWDIYRRARRSNPANFAAYIAADGFDVVSCSPELLLYAEDGRVQTRPIKGTHKRSMDPDLDKRYRDALLHSEKDLAELAMIVDLERNDLSKVCEKVVAEWPPRIETHPTVHHLVSDVSGVLSQGYDLIDLLAAVFPGGSITGAPKIRAMQIIDALEPVARGPYCGAIGYLGFNDKMVWSVAIRTMVIKSDRAYIHAGGGIVADSTPEGEYEELLVKAQGMFRAIAPERSAECC